MKCGYHLSSFHFSHFISIQFCRVVRSLVLIYSYSTVRYFSRVG